MSKIQSVMPMAGYKLEVCLENGCSVTLNFESKLNTIRFGMLSDQIFFRSATTDGSYIRWDNKIEVSASEVFQLAQK